jgi:hypothetical protein
VAGYGVVVALIDDGEGVGICLADVVDLLDVFRFEVGEAELGFALEGEMGVGEHTCLNFPAL